MRSKLLFSAVILALGAGLLSSCIKEGDLEGLHHPIHLTGTFDPNLGAPIGWAEMSVGDLLAMFKQSEGFMEVDEDGIVNIKFDTVIRSHFDVNKGRKDFSDAAAVYRMENNGSINIDLFENIPNLPSEDDMSVSNVFVDLVALVKAAAAPNTAALMESHNVVAVLDSIQLSAVAANGTQHAISLADTSYTIPASNLAGSSSEGCELTLLRDEDISYLLNYRPKRIDYSFVFKLLIPADAFATDLTTFVEEELQIRSFDVSSYVGVRFPLSVYLNDLSYDIDLKVALGDSLFAMLDRYDAELEESHLILDIENGMPLSFNLGASIKDESGSVLCQLLDNGGASIAGAPVTDNPTWGTYVANGTTTGRLDFVLTQATIDALRHAASIGIASSVSTSSASGASKPLVSIQEDDMLGVKAYVQIHPKLTIDIPLTGSDSENK